MDEISQPLSPNLVRAIQTLHPYPRYGIAAALAIHGNGKQFTQVTEQELRSALSTALLHGLSRFRMATSHDPAITDVLVYQEIKLEHLREDINLVQSAGLASKGKYLFPSVVTTDASAKNTFAESERLLSLIENDEDLLKPTEMKRSFAPVMGEVNNGKAEKQNLKASLLEAVASAIATLTPDKPSMMTGGSNKAIFPDLPLEELYEFVRVFNIFVQVGAGELMQCKLSRTVKDPNAKPKKVSKTSTAPKSEYRRPLLHSGNYPDAPRDGSFGAVGLLASMGYWASRADEHRDLTLHALETLKNRPLYILSVDGSSQARFSHYVVDLAKSGLLRDMLRDFYMNVRPYAVYDQALMRRDTPLFAHLFRATNRFLQEFDAASFRDFLSTRAEYPPAINKLFEVYFMQNEPGLSVPAHIVGSARALGEWINRAAYFIAEEDTKDVKNQQEDARRKAKAKVLVEIESLIMSAKEPAEMTGRVLRTIGQASQQDAPAEAKPFLDYANAGELPLRTAQYLLLTYMRVRSTPKTSESTKASEKASDVVAATDADMDMDDLFVSNDTTN